MSTIGYITNQYQTTSNWFVSVIDGINDKDGSRVLSENTNSLEWLAGHLITGRYRNLLRIGAKVEPYNQLEKFINQTLPPPNAIAFSKDIKYPSLTESKQQWIEYAKLFLERLNQIDEIVLKTTLPFTLPTGGTTVEDALLFLALHETYHIGQMSIIRKALGYSEMQLNKKHII